MPIVDEISPRTYGEDRIDLTLSRTTPSPTALKPVVVDVDYSRTVPDGVVLPLEVVFVGPSGSSTYQRRVFSRFAPTSLAFTPKEGGAHLVRLREQHHNRWFGALTLDVAGNPLREEAEGG